MSLKLKRGTKDKIESALSDAMAQLEVEDSTSDDLKKKELALKRIVTKASKFVQASNAISPFCLRHYSSFFIYSRDLLEMGNY
jgi:hypothetical protein